jgi:hypothetical protein
LEATPTFPTTGIRALSEPTEGEIVKNAVALENAV